MGSARAPPTPQNTVRITDEHRLVYRIDDGGDIHIVACRHHYGD